MIELHRTYIHCIDLISINGIAPSCSVFSFLGGVGLFASQACKLMKNPVPGLLCYFLITVALCVSHRQHSHYILLTSSTCTLQVFACGSPLDCPVASPLFGVFSMSHFSLREGLVIRKENLKDSLLVQEVY